MTDPILIVDPDQALAVLDARDPFLGLSAEAIERVPMDIIAGISPDESTLSYGPIELAYRDAVVKWYDSHEEAGLELPFDVASDDIPIPEDG
jgi:hypothetical protein